MKERNAGVDLLRCVAMTMVLVLHLLLFSGSFGVHPLYSAEYETIWALEILAYGAVDIYALISGYIGAGSRVRYAGLAYLWCTAAFYSFFITLICRFWKPLEYNLSPDGFFPPLVKALFPVASSQYWYFCSYFLMFLFLPLVNRGLETLSERRLKTVAWTLFFALCVVNVISYNDALRVSLGYSPMWLLSLYVLGAAIKKTGFGKDLSKTALFSGFVFLSGVTFLSKYLLDLYTMKTRGQVYRDDYLIRYVSPTVVGGAVCLLLLFSKLNPGKAARRAIGFLAPSAFSVYLIHEHPLLREFVMKKEFVFIKELTAPQLVLIVPALAAGLFLACVAVDLLRRGLFRLLKVKQRLGQAEEVIAGRLRGAPRGPDGPAPQKPETLPPPAAE